MSSTSFSQGPAMASLQLSVRKMGNVPAFKNSKSIVKNRKTGAMFIMTNAGLKKRMSAIRESFVSQLLSAFQTEPGATLTDAQRRSLMRSLPHDDNWMCISELVITSQLVPKGDEGADVVIERINVV